MRALSAENSQRNSPLTGPVWKPAVASTPRAPSGVVDANDDWDPHFYVPALFFVATLNAVALWWLAA